VRVNWKFVLPGDGLLLFAAISYHSFNHPIEVGRYFWWGSIRLDSDPLNKKVWITDSYQNGSPISDGWDSRAVWVDPGLAEQFLVITALPAFVVGALIVHGLRHFGISQVVSFMGVMPILICAWFYFVGWLLRRLSRRGANLPT